MMFRGKGVLFWCDFTCILGEGEVCLLGMIWANGRVQQALAKGKMGVAACDNVRVSVGVKYGVIS